jgi:hypothetical protein
MNYCHIISTLYKICFVLALYIFELEMSISVLEIVITSFGLNCNYDTTLGLMSEMQGKAAYI